MAVFTVSITYDYNNQTYTDLIFDSMDHTPAHNVISPVVKLELNKAGTLEFTAHPLLTSHDDTRQLFNHITPLNTFVTAKYDDTVIFHGRVLYCNTDFYRQKKVYCEGDLAFLVDSICNKFDYTGTGIEKEQLFANLITAHNSQVETKKQLTVGTISAGDKDEVIKIKSDNYIETWSAIEQYVLKGSRGFIRTRYENGTIYIDWLAGWDRENETTGFGRTNTQRIEFGRNLLELDDGINANEIFTRLVPIGKDGLTIAVNPNDPIYMDITGGVQKYGYITRVKEFNDITDKAKLVEKATEYTYYALSGIEHTYSVKAVDLHLQDDTIMNYQLGDVVELYSPLQDIYKTKVIDGQTVSVGVKRVCTAVEYHLADIENTAYSFGIPENADPSESSASSHTSGSGKSTGSKTSSSASSQITTEKKEAEKTEQRYEWVATRTDENGKILQQAGIQLTASGIIHYATDYEYNIRRQFKRVFIQMTNPSENNEIVEGDVWIVTDGIQTWQQMGAVGRSWADSSDLNWEDYAGCKQYIWKNGAWIILNDSAKELYNTTKIDQNAERIALLADNVEAYHAEFVVSANQIRSEVQDTNNAIGSRITQTAVEIKSEVWASNSTLYSTISQTATQIRAEVADTANGLQSSIDITANAIRSEVSAANSTIYSTIEQTASSIRSSVTDAANSLHSEILQTANSIYQAVYNPSGSVGAMIAIGMNQIRSEVYDPSGSIFSSITQTNNNIQIAIASSENAIRSEIVASASSIYQAVYSPNSSIMAMVQVNVDQVYQAVYNPSGSIAAMISVGMNDIRSEVYSPTGSIFTTITQSDSSIMAYAGTKARVWIQMTTPPSSEVQKGDYWIHSNSIHTWGDLGGRNWTGTHGANEFNWEDYSGCLVQVWNGSAWEDVVDSRELVANKTRLDITEEHIELLAKDVDDYRAEFEVRASQIRAEVNDANNQIGSRITQTAQQIKSEVWASNSQLYSTISQTATQIRAEVTDAISGLQGSITVNSNKIALVVTETSGGNVVNAASIVTYINNSASGVEINANKIKLNGYILANKVQINSSGAVYFPGAVLADGNVTINDGKKITIGGIGGGNKTEILDGIIDTYRVNVGGGSIYVPSIHMNDTGGDKTATWQNKTVATTSYTTSRNFIYMTSGGTTQQESGRLVTGTTTIYYLGRSGA